MKSLLINNTATDLLAQDTPFLPGQTVVVTGANGLVIQGSEDAGFTSPQTLGTIPAANAFLTIQPVYRYIRVSTSANAWLLNN
jgi:hypothetical protein